MLGKVLNTRSAMLRALEEDWPVVHITKSEEVFNYEIFKAWADESHLIHNEHYVIVDRSLDGKRQKFGFCEPDTYFAMISFRDGGLASMFKLAFA